MPLGVSPISSSCQLWLVLHHGQLWNCCVISIEEVCPIEALTCIDTVGRYRQVGKRTHTHLPFNSKEIAGCSLRNCLVVQSVTQATCNTVLGRQFRTFILLKWILLKFGHFGHIVRMLLRSWDNFILGLKKYTILEDKIS